MVYGGPVDPGGSSPPCRSGSSLAVMGGSVPPFPTPVQIPSVGLSRSLHTEPVFFCGGSRPPPFMAPPVSGPALSRWPDPDKDVPLTSFSVRGLLSASVSFGKFHSGSSVGRTSGDKYHGENSSFSSSGSCGGARFHSSLVRSSCAIPCF